MLTDHQVASYRRGGYLALGGVFTDEEMAELREVTDDFVERSRAVADSDAVFDIEPEHTAERPLLRRLKDPEKQHPAYDAAMRNPELLDALEQLVGPDVRFLSSKLNLKMPGSKTPVEWHQDWAFGGYTNDDILTVGITLDRMAVANGCLMVIPGTHQGPVRSHWEGDRFVGSVTDDDFDPTDGAVPIELPAGGVSMHHVRALHGSASNVSTIPRRLLLFTYASADAWPLSGIPDMVAFDAQIVRGEAVRAPRLEKVPVKPWPRWHELELGEKTSLFDMQTQGSRSSFRQVAS